MKMKKLIVIATSIAIIGMASPIFGATVAELEAQIATLLASITALQAQIALLGGGTGAVPAACTGITSLTTNLSQGSSGADVKCLQALLNQSVATQVAATGVGSAGSETTYFGSLTKAAVVKYQTANTISPAVGYVGPLTRAKLNTVLAGGVPPVACSATVPCSTGYTCQSGTCVLTSVGPATAGTYTVTIGATPANSTYVAGADKDVYSFDVRAFGSNINITRADLEIGVTDANGTHNPSVFVTGVKVYCGTTLAKEFTGLTFTQDANSVYFTQLSGFSCVVPKDGTTNILFKFSSGGTDVNKTIAVRVYTNGIMGTDGLGVNAFSAFGGVNATIRTHVFQASTLMGTLTFALAGDNPTSNNVYNDATYGSLNVPLMKFTLKATAGDVTLTRWGVNTVSNTASRLVPSVLRLYDVTSGKTLLNTSSDNRDIMTFENFRFPIGIDTTKILQIEGDYPANDVAASVIDDTNDYLAAIQINAAAGLPSNCIFERSTGTQTWVPVTANTASNNMFLYRRGVKFTWLSGTTSIVATEDGKTADAVLKFKVQPFNGSLIVTRDATWSVPAATNTDQVIVEAYYNASGGVLGASATVVVIRTVANQTYTTANPVPDGVEDTVTTTMTVLTTLGSGNLGDAIRFKIDSVSWDVNAAVVGVEDSSGRSGNMMDNWFTGWINI